MPYVYMMDSTYKELADRAIKLLEKSDSYRIIILLIGAPGSGKSTIAQRVVDILNEQHRSNGKQIIVKKDDTEKKHELIDFGLSLPKYDPSIDIDVEDESYTPTHELINQNEIIIRGRGGDDTAIKIKYDENTQDVKINDHDENKVNSNDSNPFAQVIPMDGFHLPISILQQFKDSTNAIRRRGSPFTFDSSLLVELIQFLNKTLDSTTSDITYNDVLISNGIPNIYIPSFDHAEHDPKKFGIKIESSTRVLIVEGLYLLLNNPIWCQIAQTLEPTVSKIDESELINELQSHNDNNDQIKDIPIPVHKTHEFWKIIIDDSKMLSRVGKRHLKAGLVTSLEQGEERVKLNDLPNGQKVYRESFKSDLNIISIDDFKEE